MFVVCCVLCFVGLPRVCVCFCACSVCSACACVFVDVLFLLRSFGFGIVGELARDGCASLGRTGRWINTLKSTKTAFRGTRFSAEETAYKIRFFAAICVVVGVASGVVGVVSGAFDWVLRDAQSVDGDLADKCRLYVPVEEGSVWLLSCFLVRPATMGEWAHAHRLMVFRFVGDWSKPASSAVVALFHRSWG